MSELTAPVAIVAGVGPGLGASLCRKLTSEGYHVAGLARTADFGEKLVTEITESGEQMTFYSCNLTDAEAVNESISRVEEEAGVPGILIYNAGSLLMNSTLDTQPDEVRRLWEINCLGAFLTARRVLPGMLKNHRGTMIFTGATAAVKASANFAAFGSSKFALRGLTQAMARELGPRGIHVVHVIIDGIIHTPRTSQMPGVSKEKCLDPDAIAETYLHLIRQHRSAWTLELDLRPDVEPF